jgi:hypothetical protein
MLVLLVIFMVTAPLLTLGVDVDLPQTNAKSVNAKHRKHGQWEFQGCIDGKRIMVQSRNGRQGSMLRRL